jgi:hypothetical protein
MAAARFQSTLRGRLTFVGINSLDSTEPAVGRAETSHDVKVKSGRLRKDLEDWGRGFSMNQVQNGGADSLWFGVHLSARFVLSAPKTATPCERPLIGTANGRPVGSFTSRFRTTLTTIAFMPATSLRLQRDR